MKIKTEKDIIRLIENDEWMINVLQMAKSLELPDWWVCAGFVRSKIWDTLHDYEAKTAMPDVDVIYYDSLHQDEIYEQSLETKLMNIDATIPWSVKNQARMHVVNNMPPYSSSVNAISKFPETATALGVTLDELNNVILTAPCGIEDVLSLQVRPTAHFLKSKERLHMYKNRVIKKNWQSKWPNITITYPEI
ncbi:TPA: nucleotidyltransferase family protein [Bacillus cereus]|uniref:nucleotidyltransferase family protein n=1 Tax=Bacillus thuringiensis TaxID=1428 RepID=UPI000A3AAFA8|nr:nucleotidyltransferase family protein [Bacillus thuringiensis]HDR8487069.1 nucleotidyltransferase family protein [Bacillus cereus]MED2128997.1 nucleotidyltransferase family protein [Bacillus thuringiensis]MED2151266.1 nucleotidyltransferase family protein [Bacillus thuringiensis]MED2174095.1 nucleotidyltransferase family protein [Bacillus thuringiensis]MED2475242.1 nucleotidyltransferase family protein [Bacillus thuringiensis]